MGIQQAAASGPYIERKLFSVNTGHATVAYTGKYLGYNDIGTAIADHRVLQQLQAVLKETGELLIAKWGFDRDEHQAYQAKIIERFENKYLSDKIARVGRTPLRKLGYNERFIRPIREAKARGLNYAVLLQTVGMIYTFDEPDDAESQQMLQMIREKPFREVVTATTGLKDEALITEIVESYQKIAN